jgi:16S rRNA (uracil1498-N3)-methyltransferase
MRIHRFIGDFNLNQKSLLVSDKNFYNQVKNVLRLLPKSKIILADGKNNEAEARIILISKDGIKLEIEKTYINQNEPEKEVFLYCAILKKENFEFVVQKATEIGIKKIIPIITKRTVKLSLNQSRLKIIAKEAAEQSGRGIVPEILTPISFSQACKDSKSNSINYFFDLSGKALENFSRKNVASAGIFIGPEGGWDENEIKMSLDFGHCLVSLGKLTFRAETAAILASYLVLNLK